MLTLICGIPSAGKTTYSSRYDNVIHYDAYHRNCHICNHAVSRIQGDVCVEGVYNTIEERKKLLDSAKHQDKKICIWLDTPLEECLEREKNSRKRMPSIILKYHERMQPPTLDEGWDEVIVVR